MSEIKAGKLTRRLLTLIALLACLTLVTPSNTSTTIAAAPAPASGYGLSGVVYYWYSHVVEGPTVVVYKWNGSSWALHGATAGDECGNFTYDAGGPGEFMLSVNGDFIITEPSTCGCYSCGWRPFAYVSGSDTAELSSANPYAYMYIITL